MADDEDAGDGADNPVMVLYNVCKDFTAADAEHTEKLPQACEGVEAQVQVVASLAQELMRDGGDKDFPADLLAQVGMVAEEVKQSAEEITAWREREAARPRWARLAPPTRSLLESHGTAVAVFIVASEYAYHAALAAMLLVATIAYLFPSLLKTAVAAWRNKETLEEFERREEDLREHANKLRHFMVMRSQLREARRYDVSKSVLTDDARRFWCTQFGAESHSVAVDRLVETLLFEANLKELSDTVRQTVCRMLVKVIDLNADGIVSPSEFHSFLRYFGPLNLCVQRTLKSLLTPLEGRAVRPHPWFTWRKLDRGSVDKVLPLQGPGAFLVRASTDPGVFAISHVPPTPAGGAGAAGPTAPVRHFRIFNRGAAGFCFQGREAYPDEHFPDLAALVAQYGGEGGWFQKPFIDHGTRCSVNVGGRRFETMAGTFLKYPHSRLGRLAEGLATGAGTDVLLEAGGGLSSATDGPAAGGGAGAMAGGIGADGVEELFFDRDPDAFAVVLNYCRTGELHVPPTICRGAVIAELAYFGLPVPVEDSDETGEGGGGGGGGPLRSSSAPAPGEAPAHPPLGRRRTYVSGALVRQPSLAVSDSVTGAQGGVAAAMSAKLANATGKSGGARASAVPGAGAYDAIDDEGVGEDGEAEAEGGATGKDGEAAEEAFEEPSSSEWHHGVIAREAGRAMLAGKPQGSFLFRASASDPRGSVVLVFVNDVGNVEERKLFIRGREAGAPYIALTPTTEPADGYRTLRQFVVSGVAALTKPVSRAR